MIDVPQKFLQSDAKPDLYFNDYFLYLEIN
jgi:hypothetical protein